MQSVIRHFLYFFAIGCLVFIDACSTQSNYAPVINGWAHSESHRGGYRVQRGDTLYSIAFRFGKDYHELAKANHILAPYALHPGQEIQIPTNNLASLHKTTTTTLVKSATRAKTKNNPTAASKRPIRLKEARHSLGWIWPIRGKVINESAQARRLNKGIDIVGRDHDPVHATLTGTVVYSGNGLRGYGYLVIIKHRDDYLSAYAHNSKLLVSENQKVKQGDTIALTGNSASKRSTLHFEIRRYGKPVDPLRYLPKQST